MTGSRDQFMEQREAESMSQQEQGITRYVNPVQLTKAAADGNAELIADMARDGFANPLELSAKIAWMVSVLEKARKLIQEDAVAEIEKHNGKAVILGVKIEKAETGTKYDYAGCGDSTWEQYDAAAASASESRKEREKFLRSLPGPITIGNDQTGEIETITPPVKSSTTNVKISFE